MIYQHQETLNKILTYIKGSGWEQAMSSYWKSNNFKNIITQLHQYVDEDKRFTPKVKDMFRWMSECPWGSIKCVMFIDDTRHFVGIPGIPFSQDKTYMTKKRYDPTEERENKNEEIEQFIQRVKREKNDKFNYDLSGWCNQGVLMMPYKSTHRVGMVSKAHADLWEEFRARIIEEIGYTYPNIPWVLVNTNTFSYRELIRSKHILNVRTEPKMENNHWPFWINKHLIESGKEPIIWNREDKDPFPEELTKLAHINFGSSILKGYF